MDQEMEVEQHEPKSVARRSVAIIGLDPSLIDFSSPDFAPFPGLTADKVMAGITAAEEGLLALGYDAQHYHIDFGQTAEAVVTAILQKKYFDWGGRSSRPEQSHSF